MPLIVLWWSYLRFFTSVGVIVVCVLFQTVGRWSEKQIELELDALSWTGGARKVPTSACSEPCAVGMIKRHHKKVIYPRNISTTSVNQHGHTLVLS